MVEADYTLHADADGDELFETDEALIDVVRDSDGITYSRGLDGIRRLDEARAGDFGAYLDNRAGTYNPGAAGEIQRGVSLKLRAAYGGTTRDLCHVDVSRVKHWPALTKKAVELRGRGKLARFARRPVSTTLYQSITTGVAIGHLLDAIGWPKNIADYLAGLGNLVGYWKLNETSGTNANDSGSGGNDGTYVNAPTLDAADLDDEGNGAPDFNGTTQYVSGSAAALPQGSAARSIVMRVNLDTLAVEDQPLFSYGSLAVGQAILVEAHYTKLRVGRYGANSADSTTALTASTDLTITVTIDASRNVIFYINGVEAGTTSLDVMNTGIGSGFRIADAIAGWGLATTGNGRVGHLAVFNRVLTPAEAAAIHARFEDAPRHLDAGQTTLPFYHANATDALQELMRIVRSEGPGAYLYEDASGAITFLDRHATITQARSTSAQGTLRGTGTAPLYSDYDYEDGLDDVINLVKVSAVRRALSAAGYLWQSQLPYASLAPGETKKVTAKLDDPGTGFVTGLLTTNPTYASTLAAAIGDTTTLTFTLPTGEATMITTNAIIDIEGEYMLVASRATGSPNDTVTVVSRGAYGTTAATHLISTAVRTRAFIASAESTFGNATNLTDSITVTISRTGGISTEFSFTNNAAVTAYLFARLYGQEAAIQERYELKNTVDASASIAAHGERSYDLDVIPEVDVDVLQDWCNAVVGWYQDGRPTVTVEVIGNLGADEMAQALDREIADRVRVIHAGTGVDLQALVHRIETTVELGGALHRARLLCESADTASYLKFGTSTFGGADLFAW